MRETVLKILVVFYVFIYCSLGSLIPNKLDSTHSLLYRWIDSWFACKCCFYFMVHKLLVASIPIV